MLNGDLVRDAVMDDVDDIVQMGRRMHVESRYRTRSFDPEKVRRIAKFLIADQRGILIVALHGFIAGGVDEDWYGGDLTATEYALYVEQEHRGGMTAAKLIRAYVERAKELGATDIQIENSTEVAPAVVMKLFTRLGFRQVGGKFSLGV